MSKVSKIPSKLAANPESSELFVSNASQSLFPVDLIAGGSLLPQ